MHSEKRFDWIKENHLFQRLSYSSSWSYYGITCSFIDDNWILQSLVIDFLPSHGKHIGKDITICFFKVIDDYELNNKLMGITVDKAMDQLVQLTKSLKSVSPKIFR